MNEQGVRKVLPQCVPILDLWDDLCQLLFDYRIGVISIGKKDVESYDSLQDEFNTAFLTIHDERVILTVVLNDLSKPKPAVLSHEVGHWILKLKGYKGVRKEEDPHGLIVAHINNLFTHRPVWKLVKEMGIDPNQEIFSAGAGMIDSLLIRSEPSDYQQQVELALWFYDNLLNCEPEQKKALESILKVKYPKVNKIVEKLRKILDKYDTNNPSGSENVVKEIPQALSLEGTWMVPDEIQEIKEMIKKVRKV